MPLAFFYSTGVIALSSMSLFYAAGSFERENYKQYLFWLIITLSLGLSFAALQYAGWLRMGVFTEGLGAEVGRQFVVLITGLHLLHVALGLLAIVYLVAEAFLSRNWIDGFLMSQDPFKKSRIKLLSIFWHFVDLAWLLMFAFLWLNAS
jgi:cytochrome c oxidase subunit 3